MEAFHASLLGVFKIVETAPVIALVAEGTGCCCVVDVFCCPKLGSDADPFVGVAVARILVAAACGGFTAFVEVLAEFDLLILFVDCAGGELAVLVVTVDNAFDVTVFVRGFDLEGSVFVVLLGQALPAVGFEVRFTLEHTTFVVFLFEPLLLVFHVGGLEADFAAGELFDSDIFTGGKREECSDDYGGAKEL